MEVQDIISWVNGRLRPKVNDEAHHNTLAEMLHELIDRPEDQGLKTGDLIRVSPNEKTPWSTSSERIYLYTNAIGKHVCVDVAYTQEYRQGSGYATAEWEHIIEKPKDEYIDWTCETAPDNLMIRKKISQEGVYVQANVSVNHIRYTDYHGQGVLVKWQDLRDKYEQRDGSPCGEKVT